jgi:hypothetical protein
MSTTSSSPSSSCPAGCSRAPVAGVIDHHLVHDRRWHTVRHLPVAGRACRIRRRRRLLSCSEGAGPSSSAPPSIAPGAVWSRSAARAAVAMSEAKRARRHDSQGLRGGLEHGHAGRAGGGRTGRDGASDAGGDRRDRDDHRPAHHPPPRVPHRAGVPGDLAGGRGVQGRDQGSATALLAEHAPDAEVVSPANCSPGCSRLPTPFEARLWSPTPSI